MCIGKDSSKAGVRRPRNLKRVGIYCGETMVEVTRETLECGAVGQICGNAG